MIHFKEITKTFQPDFWKEKFVALDNLSFNVGEGHIVGFLGANGAGKTTSLRILMGFTDSDKGNVEFSKSLGSNRNEILSNIGFLPERPYFYPDLTGQDFLNFMGDLAGLSKQQIKVGTERWAPRFKIDFALNRKIKTYSKGMLQRIGFCSALIHDPKLIILDEPLSGLDPVGRKELKDVIKEVNQAGKTVFFSSHIVPDVEEICSKVIFIEKGKLLYEGSIDKLIIENRSSEYEIKFSDKSLSSNVHDLLFENWETDQFLFGKVKAENKSKILEVVSKENIQIESLKPVQMNLEEIFYKVKNQEREVKSE